MVASHNQINLSSFEEFSSHAWVIALQPKIDEDTRLGDSARRRLLNNLEEINDEYFVINSRAAFVTIEGRVKTPESILRKLYADCLEYSNKNGITQDSIKILYEGISDICGVRFSCPYYDEVTKFIRELVRPKLSQLGYATDLEDHPDKDMLDEGDKNGYRSYHFFVKVPAPVDIFDNTKLALCEIQVRTELQHVWAVKSHDLLYKPKEGWDLSDLHVINDMKAVSMSLRAADQHLTSIRDRVKCDREEE